MVLLGDRECSKHRVLQQKTLRLLTFHRVMGIEIIVNTT